MLHEKSHRTTDSDTDATPRGGTDIIFYKEERSAIFIDGANLYGAARALGFEIDYKLLLKWAGSRSRLVRAFYYTALIEDQEYSPIRPLVDWLDYNGYTMVTKPTKEFTDASGRRKVKGNMDIELAIDVMEMAEHVDHILLFSGDGDFRRLVEAVQRKGVRVTVVSTVRSQPPMVADELRRQADNFLELQELAPFIARKHQQRSYAAPEDDEDDEPATALPHSLTRPRAVRRLTAGWSGSAFVAQQPGLHALTIVIFIRLALVFLALAPRQAKLDFGDTARIEIDRQRHDRDAFAADRAQQLRHLFAVEQQLPPPLHLMLQQPVRLLVFGNVGVDQV